MLVLKIFEIKIETDSDLVWWIQLYQLNICITSYTFCRLYGLKATYWELFSVLKIISSPWKMAVGFINLFNTKDKVTLLKITKPLENEFKLQYYHYISFEIIKTSYPYYLFKKKLLIILSVCICFYVENTR